jgi:Tfp pilus assembly protein PilW
VSSIAESVRDEDGVSLIELVIVTAISLVIIGAVLSMLESGTKVERGTQARHSALLDLRSAIVDIDKDLRQAVSLDASSTTSHLDMCTYLSGVQRRVVYDVSSGQLTRATSSSSCSGSLGTAILVIHVTSTAPFCYDYDSVADTCGGAAPSTTTKIVHVQLAATPEVFSGGPITLATDIELRNPQQ